MLQHNQFTIISIHLLFIDNVTVRQSPDLVRLRAWLPAGQPCLVCLVIDIRGGVLILYEVSFCLTILLPYICKCIVSQLINLLFCTDSISFTWQGQYGPQLFKDSRLHYWNQ